jgi:hypothetical protein
MTGRIVLRTLADVGATTGTRVDLMRVCQPTRELNI